MKKITAIASAAALAAISLGVQAEQGFKEASANMKVRAELKDMIAITNLPGNIDLKLENADSGSWWNEYVGFTVLRSGPSNLASQPFSLTVTGSSGGNGEWYNLKRVGDDDTHLPMIIDMQDDQGSDWKDMINGQAIEFHSDLGMSDINTSKTNMNMNLSIKQSDILSKKGGDYEATFTFMVAAK